MMNPNRWRLRRGLTILLPFLALALVAASSSFVPGQVAASSPPTVAACPTLPADNVWNARVDQLPVHVRSADYLASIGLGTGLHADFGSGLWEGGPIGIPYTTVPGS